MALMGLACLVQRKSRLAKGKIVRVKFPRSRPKGENMNSSVGCQRPQVLKEERYSLSSRCLENPIWNLRRPLYRVHFHLMSWQTLAVGVLSCEETVLQMVSSCMCVVLWMVSYCRYVIQQVFYAVGGIIMQCVTLSYCQYMYCACKKYGSVLC